ncbi:MAG: PAS domain-containing protein [Devosia sp.]
MARITPNMLDAAFNDLIGRIYDAAIEPAIWHEAIESVRQRFEFEIAMLGVIKLPEGTAAVQVACNVKPPFAETIFEYTPDIPELWGGPAGMARLPFEEPILHSRVPSYRKHPGNRFYEEWCRPQSLVDEVVIWFGADRGMVANLGLGIHRERGVVAEEEFDQLRLLAPHLCRAVKISRVLDFAVDTTSTFRAAFDAIGSGALLVDRDLKIVHANRAAEEMLRLGDPIRSTVGQLELVREVLPGQLASAVAAASNESDLGRRGIGIPARRRDDTSVAMHVMPLERRSNRAGIELGAVAAVFVADAAQQSYTGANAVTLLYGLTPAEIGGRKARIGKPT